MKVRRAQILVSSSFFVVSAFLFASCGSDSPSQPTTVTPTTLPPTTTTRPPAIGAPPVRAVASVFGYVRREGNGQGRFPVPPMPAQFQVGDAIDITCTPRDAEGRDTNNHPAFVEWSSSSGGEGVLIDKYDYLWNEGDRWADQIEIRFLARTGFIDVSCKIPGTNIVSPTIRLNVYGGVR